MEVRRFVTTNAPLPIQCLALLLFVLGFPCALLAAPGFALSLANDVVRMLIAVQRRDLDQVRTCLLHLPWTILFSAQAFWGYVIWIKWLRIAADKQAAPRRLWHRAAWHHLIWVLLLIPSFNPNGFVLAYLAVIGSTCLVAGLVCGDPPEQPKAGSDEWLTGF